MNFTIIRGEKDTVYKLKRRKHFNNIFICRLFILPHSLKRLNTLLIFLKEKKFFCGLSRRAKIMKFKDTATIHKFDLERKNK